VSHEFSKGDGADGWLKAVLLLSPAVALGLVLALVVPELAVVLAVGLPLGMCVVAAALIQRRSY